MVATDADGDQVTTTLQTTIVPVAGSNTAGGPAGETINGSTAMDVLAGNAGNDTINGGDGADSLYGNGGNDILNGGNGNDAIVGGPGADTLSGGAGVDTFVIDVSALSGTQTDSITDYAAGEVINIAQLLNTGGSLSGFVRLTAAGQLQVDVNGGGDGFITVATLAAGVNAAIAYSNGTTTASATIVSGAPPVVLDLDGDGVEFSASRRVSPSIMAAAQCRRRGSVRMTACWCATPMMMARLAATSSCSRCRQRP